MLYPDAVSRLATKLSNGSVIVSSTNGKTTTAGMIAGILKESGVRTVHNKAGSNMNWGVATALLEADGTAEPSLGLFEVDEAWLSELVLSLEPKVVVLGNLFRDQLDRYGELERLADDWASVVESLPAGCRLVLCADDPSIADLRDLAPDGVETVLFGIEDSSRALESRPHASDPKYCRDCGSRYSYESHFVGHLGLYSCPDCSRLRPLPDITAADIHLEGLSGSRFDVLFGEQRSTASLPLPGLYNVYNALAAVGASVALKLPLERSVEALSRTAAAFGRSERIQVPDGEIALLLIKNPTGANEVLKTLQQQSEGDGPLDLWIGLNDGIADGRDISWVWDADFELLAASVARVTCSGTRAPEMALRLRYAGWPTEAITVDPDLTDSLFAAVHRAQGKTLYGLPTYTSLLEIHRALAERGYADEFWQ